MKKFTLNNIWLLFWIFISCGTDISDFHNKSFIADTHNDVLLRSMSGRNILSDLPESHSDLKKFEKAYNDYLVSREDRVFGKKTKKKIKKFKKKKN